MKTSIQNLNNYSRIQSFGLRLPFFKNRKDKNTDSATNTSQQRRILNVTNSQYDIQIQKKRQRETLNNFLSNPNGKVTINEYNQIIKNNPNILIECQKICEENCDNLSSTPKDIALAAVGLKKYYDKMYGENYTILSIGTSPAAISEVMQALGSEVIFLPISGAIATKRYPYTEHNKNLAKKFKNVDIMMKYLTSKGITKNKDKKILLLDYVQSGKTLEIVEQILRERNDIPHDNLHKHSLINDIDTMAHDIPDLKDAKLNIEWDAATQKIENIGNVPHFYCNETALTECYDNTIHTGNKSIKEIFQEIDNFSTPNARAWALCAIHEAVNHKSA